MRLRTLLCIFLIFSASLPAAAQTSPDIGLRRTARPWAPFTVVGQQAFWVGKESGEAEAWVVPFKILHGLNLAVKLQGEAYWLDLRRWARKVTARPEGFSVCYEHPAFRLDVEFIAPLHQPGLLLLLRGDLSRPLVLRVSFYTDLQPMWPAGLGGQYSYWDDREKAFVLSESRRKYGALVGSPFATGGIKTPAHALPDAPVQFLIPLAPDSVRNRTFPLIIAGGPVSPDSARAVYRRLANQADRYRREARDFYRTFLARTLSPRLPDDSLNLALKWAKVALHQGLMDNPDLGSGLVAGFGPSGKSARPGFAWFFGGDACINSWALNDIGDFEAVRAALQFMIRYQRRDGKISHEVTQSAGMIPWFKEYPYPYYHADTTPYFLVAMADYVRYSGDLDFLLQNWPAVRKALDYCLHADSNGDGLMDNLKAGLGAVELGALLKNRTEVDIYLAAVWTEALESTAYLAELAHRTDLARELRDRYRRARSTLEKRFWRPRKNRLSFALLAGGKTLDQRTPWQAVPLCFGLLPEEKADAVLTGLSSPDMATDWGIRFLPRSNPDYRYSGYNSGAVWPFTTLFSIWAAFRNHWPDFGLRQWQNIARLTFVGQLGTVSELFSGDRPVALETAVPHQLFSSTPVVLGLTRGVLGYRPDVPARTLAFMVHWPRGWKRARIARLAYGTDPVSLSLTSGAKSIVLEFTRNRAERAQMLLSFALRRGETLTSVEVNGKAVPFRTVKFSRDRHVRIKIPFLTEKTAVRLNGRFLVK